VPKFSMRPPGRDDTTRTWAPPTERAEALSVPGSLPASLLAGLAGVERLAGLAGEESSLAVNREAQGAAGGGVLDAVVVAGVDALHTRTTETPLTP